MSAETMNLMACCIVVAANLVALDRMQRVCEGQHRFLFRSFACWFMAWVVWVVLWALEAKHISLAPIPLELMSDVNTGLFVLMYLGLTRGNDMRIGEYFTKGLAITVILMLAAAALINAPGKVGGQMHREWSLALSIFAPFLVGWGFRLRYQTTWVLVAAFPYALMQPAAYAALQLPDSSDPDLIAARSGELAILAFLKVVFAFSVIYWYGFLPNESDSIVVRQSSHSYGRTDKFWPAIPFGMVVLALIFGIIWLLSDSRLGNLYDSFRWITIVSAAVTVTKFVLDHLIRRKEG